MSNPSPTWTPARIEVFENQIFDDTHPGTLLKDFNSLLEFIGDNGIAVSNKTHLFALNTLAELNQRLSHPLEVKLKRPVQKSFPHLNGLYLLLRSSGLSRIAMQNKKPKLMLHPKMLAIWKTLTPTERYFSLFQALFYRADAAVIGERTGFFMPTAFFGCFSFFQDHLVKHNKLHFPEIDMRTRLRYSPGLHNLALMELFGFIDIQTYPATEKETWSPATIELTAWGEAVFNYFVEYTESISSLFMDDIQALDSPILSLLVEGIQHNTMIESQDSKRKTLFEQEIPSVAPDQGWEEEFKQYIPTWKTSLLEVEVESELTELQTGTYIFKVAVGKTYRKLAVPSQVSLDGLAYAILGAFEFSDTSHLYEFVYKNEYGIKEHIAHPYVDADDENCFSTDNCTVGQLPLYEGMTFVFRFDFGDSWEFKIQVESLAADMQVTDITLIGGSGFPPKQYEDDDEDENHEEN